MENQIQLQLQLHHFFIINYNYIVGPSPDYMFYWTFTDSWANRIQASKQAMAKRQYSRCARES